MASLSPVSARPPTVGGRRWVGLIATGALVALAIGLACVRPIGGPWWTNPDPDGVYVGQGLALLAERPTGFSQHPGVPLQEALGLTFAARWAADPGGRSRAEFADSWFRDLDAARPWYRGLMLLLLALSLVAVVIALARVLGHWAWGALGGLLFLALPDLLSISTLARPDIELSALCVVTGAVTVEAFRRRSAELYLAAAALLGWGMSWKIHAVGLVAPLAVALMMRPPAPGWVATLRHRTGKWTSRHRRPILAGCAAWIAVIVVLNLHSAPLSRNNLAVAIAALMAGAVAGTLVFLVRGTRIGHWATLVTVLVAAFVAGAIVPNLFFPTTLPPMVTSLGSELLGGGANEPSPLGTFDLGKLVPWLPLWGLAAVGAANALRAGRRENIVWIAGVVAMTVLAAAQAGSPRYFMPALALAIPLFLQVVGRPGARPPALALVLVAAVCVVPIRDGIRQGRGARHEIASAQRLNAWAEHRLRPGEVAVTTFLAPGSGYQHFVAGYQTVPPPTLSSRIIEDSPEAILAAHRAKQRIRFLIDPPVRWLQAPDRARNALRGDPSKGIAPLPLPAGRRPVPGEPGLYEFVTPR